MTVIVQNRYFVTEGLEDQALRVRRDASAVRFAFGRPTGEILLATGDESGGPTFIWQCEYHDLADRNADAHWADASPEFTVVRQRMGRLLDDFERHAFEVVPD